MSKPLFALPLTDVSPSCSVVQNWVQVQKQPPALTITEREQDKQKKWKIMQQTTKDIFTAFFYNKSFSFDELESCLNDIDETEKNKFFSRLEDTFFDQTLQYLSRSNGPFTQRVVSLIQKKKARGDVLITKILGSLFGKAPIDYRAGYHRPSHIAFIDISKVSANEFPVVFIHEMLHNLDEDQYEAMNIQSQTWRQSLYKSTDRKDLNEFERLIESFLDLGLWAEYRTFYYTIIIYLEGLKDNLWSSIPWLEELYLQPPPHQTLAKTIYLRLDQKSRDPTPEDDAYLASPNILPWIQKIRAKYREPYQPPPSRGHLQKLFKK